jgi:hypothetical protein
MVKPDPADWAAPPRFTAAARKSVTNALGEALANGSAGRVLADLEAAFSTFVLVRDGRLPSRKAVKALDRLAAKVEALRTALQQLDNETLDGVMDGLTHLGYDPRFLPQLTDRLDVLDNSLALALAGRISPRPGRPRESARLALACAVAGTLRRHGVRPTAYIRGPFRRCLQAVFVAAGEPFPEDPRDLLTAALRQ